MVNNPIMRAALGLLVVYLAPFPILAVTHRLHAAGWDPFQVGWIANLMLLPVAGVMFVIVFVELKPK